MAQAGYTPIKLYASSTAAAVPLAANLDNTNGAELAINIADGKLYFKNSSNAVTLLAQSGAASPVTTLSFGTTGLTPSTATSGAVTVAGTLVVANGGTGLTSFTAGQIHYGSFLTSTNLFFDASNVRFGLGTNTPAVTATFVGSDAMLIPKGNTAARPTGVSGYLRFNTQTSEFEGHNGTAWSSVGGSAISNDTATATDLFPTFLSATTGTATSIFTSNAKLLYKPSTGEFKASAFVATNGFVVNSATVAADYTVAAGQNAMSVGPMTINSGITVTVSSGQRYVIL